MCPQSIEQSANSERRVGIYADLEHLRRGQDRFDPATASPERSAEERLAHLTALTSQLVGTRTAEVLLFAIAAQAVAWIEALEATS